MEGEGGFSRHPKEQANETNKRPRILTAKGSPVKGSSANETDLNGSDLNGSSALNGSAGSTRRKKRTEINIGKQQQTQLEDSVLEVINGNS